MEDVSEKPKGAVGLVIKEGMVLLDLRNSEKSRIWEIPGGGVENGETAEEAVKRELKEFDLVYVGRLIKTKGLDKLIRALKGSKIKLAIYGEGPELENLINLSKIMNVDARFFGYIKAEDLPNAYSSAKVGVFPSISREGVVTSMLEAMSCGLPVIVTDKGSMWEAVQFGGGRIMASTSRKSFLKAIEFSLNNRDKLTNEARKIVLDKFDLLKNTRKLEAFYMDVIKRNRNKLSHIK